MSIRWPDYLINEIVDKRCILFLGSGVSMDAKPTSGTGLKTWGSFIQDARDKLVQATDQKKIIDDFIRDNNYLLALQAIKKYSDRSDYLTFLNDELNKSLNYGELHEIIYDLDVKTLITTNFDKVYESMLHSYHKGNQGFHVVSYDSDSVIDHIRSKDILLIQAHGTISNPAKMIFTKEEYLKAKKDNPHFYRTLQALFITNTVLFIGCSLTDPDILLILEELRELGRYSKTHYCTILETKSNEIIEEDWLQSYSVKALKYGPAHEDLKVDLKNLREQVATVRAASGAKS